MEESYIKIICVLCVVASVIVIGYFGITNEGTEKNTTQEAQKKTINMPYNQTYADSYATAPEITQCETCGVSVSQSPTPPQTTTPPTIIPTFIPTTFTQSPTPAPTPENYVKPAYDTKPCNGLLFNMNGNLMWIMKENEDKTYDVTDYNKFIQLMESLKDEVEQGKDTNLEIPVQKMTYGEILKYIQS